MEFFTTPHVPIGPDILTYKAEIAVEKAEREREEAVELRKTAQGFIAQVDDMGDFVAGRRAKKLGTRSKKIPSKKTRAYQWKDPLRKNKGKVYDSRAQVEDEAGNGDEHEHVEM